MRIHFSRLSLRKEIWGMPMDGDAKLASARDVKKAVFRLLDRRVLGRF